MFINKRRHFVLYIIMSDTKKQCKLAILMLGADTEICPGFTFFDEYTIAKETWADFSKLEPNSLKDDTILIYYDGGRYMKDELIDEGNGHYVLHLACEDEMSFTFKKTWLAYKYVYDNFLPAWIFRTNTSTYVNVDVLYDFIDNYAKPEITYGSDLYSLSEACCPWPLCIYPRGNGVLTHHKIYKPCIIENGISLAYQKICDDICFGILINSYNINKHGNYLNFIKGLPHAWYKCVDVLFDNNHKFSRFGDSNLNYHDFVTITVKKYRDREKEKEHYLALHEKIKSDPIGFNAKPYWTNEMLDYVDNYSTFVGSILGYLDFDVWNNIDKNELFLKEICNKASDDEQHYIYKDVQGKVL